MGLLKVISEAGIFMEQLPFTIRLVKDQKDICVRNGALNILLYQKAMLYLKKTYSSKEGKSPKHRSIRMLIEKYGKDDLGIPKCGIREDNSLISPKGLIWEIGDEECIEFWA